jgi:hypothetical protein
MIKKIIIIIKYFFLKKYYDNLREKPLEVCNLIKRNKKLVWVNLRLHDKHVI